MKATAEIVGTVWRILRAEGEPVSVGDPLVLIESMKMEIPIAAPCAGTITKVLVAEGQLVQEGDPVAEVEPTDS